MRKHQLFTCIVICCVFLASSCGISKHKDLTYLPAGQKYRKDIKLDIYGPAELSGKKDVLVFLHGGGWNKGKKSFYKFFGKRLARKDVVGVIMNYPLSPEANYNDMAAATAGGIKWLKENISKYGGDPERIFISGHSAGGHIAALIAVREKYFDSLNLKDPLKGVILIDAAGLDMNKYLIDQEKSGKKHYLGAFTTDNKQWIEASPIYHLRKEIVPMLVLAGEKTYPNIKDSNERFVKESKEKGNSVTYTVIKRKRHIPMIFQFYNSRNRYYKEIINFMKMQK